MLHPGVVLSSVSHFGHPNADKIPLSGRSWLPGSAPGKDPDSGKKSFTPDDQNTLQQKKQILCTNKKNRLPRKKNPLHPTIKIRCFRGSNSVTPQKFSAW
jgi:hypothetical protein